MSRSCASVNEAMVPWPAVVRSTVASWHTTSSPSAVAWTSSSMPVAPASSAWAMACSVDEGDSQAPALMRVGDHPALEPHRSLTHRLSHPSARR